METSKIPWYVGTALCAFMLVPGLITSWLTFESHTYNVGTFYGVVCITVFGAVGIYHRRKLNGRERRKV
jgi:nitrate reductase gamma subunit